ncbi:MAG: citrate synthase [Candidatus Electrothrix sp. GM3_4]|nr:citrate synthase [Candidatus Electrothrix sp. GM3_4]
MIDQKFQVRKRDEQFASRTVTRIWQEEPLPENPYLASKCRCHGYDILELVQKRTFVDVLFLLFQGELPDQNQAEFLEKLMIALINPGPRHPATRASMNAAVGKANPAHILPAGLAVLSGAHLGGEEVSAAMRFLRKNYKKNAADLAKELLTLPRPDEGDWHIAPGFGSRFNGIDPMPMKTAVLLSELPAARTAVKWGQEFAEAIIAQEMGWLDTGIAAAVLCDLGFHPRAGAGLFQIFRAPGILAHGLELANKPKTAMPFLDEEHYVIAEQAKKK